MRTILVWAGEDSAHRFISPLIVKSGSRNVHPDKQKGHLPPRELSVFFVRLHCQRTVTAGTIAHPRNFVKSS